MLPRLLLLAVIVNVVTAEYCRFEINKRHAKYARCQHGCCTGECCEAPEEEEGKTVGFAGGAVLMIVLSVVIGCLCRRLTGGDCSGEVEIDI